MKRSSNSTFLRDFIVEDNGQAIMEYAALLALVAVVVVVVFAVGTGTLAGSLQQSFSAVVQKLAQLNSYTSGM